MSKLKDAYIEQKEREELPYHHRNVNLPDLFETFNPQSLINAFPRLAQSTWEKWDDAVCEGRLSDARNRAKQLLDLLSRESFPRWTSGQRTGFLNWCVDQQLV